MLPTTGAQWLAELKQREREQAMAAGSLMKEFFEEATCSVCLEYFKEPVTIDCGHNFCLACLSHCWGESDRAPFCPQCQEVFQQKNFRPNQQLANLVELVRKLQTGKGVEGKVGGRERPQEPLKHFRYSDQTSTMSKPREEERMTGVRGVSWKRGEILDLLELWGDQTVQTALRESHRNKDIFEDVAKAMVERGHKRTGEECRTKTKGLRMAYRRALSVNDQSDELMFICPYFEELDRILKGDPSAKSKRLTQNVHRENAPRREALPQEATVDLFPLKIEERDKVQEEAGSTSGTHDGPSDVQTHMEDSVLEIPEETMMDMDMEEGTVEASQQEEEISACFERENPEEIPPGVAMSDLSPSSRLALMQAKKKKVSAVQRVGEEMMRQSSREHRAMLKASNEEHREFMSEMRAAREEERRSNQAICSLFREALSMLSEMSRVILQSRMGVAEPRVQNDVEEHHSESVPSASEVGELTRGETQEESSQVVTPPPETTTTATGRPTGTMDVKWAGKAQRSTFAAVRTRRVVRATKPYSPSK